MSEIVVRPSEARAAEWTRALAEPGSPLLDRLVAEEPPGTAHFYLMVHVNRSYRIAQRAGLPPEAAFPAVERALGPLRRVRAPLGPLARRALDLGLLRWVRRSSALTPVLGAGVTMDAGGPSWAALVDALLEIALTRGRETAEMRLDPGSTDTHKTFTRYVTGAVRLDAEKDAEARAIRAAISAGEAGVDSLLRGVEVCLGLMGQSLFADVTSVLYGDGKREPGPIHRAIAELSESQLVPDRIEERNPPAFSGWESVVTYNFDDFMGMAIDDRGLPRAAWAMRGDKLAGDPNAAAKKAGQGSAYQAIYHMHGYTPRRFFNVTHVKFVFSASQYVAFYSGDPTHVMTRVLDDTLAHPIKYALYVGCSFEDEKMNDLLRAAAERLPGRDHYALLRWPERTPFVDASAADLETKEARYLDFGVRPVWFERFDEIPALIRSLR